MYGGLLATCLMRAHVPRQGDHVAGSPHTASLITDTISLCVVHYHQYHAKGTDDKENGDHIEIDIRSHHLHAVK